MTNCTTFFKTALKGAAFACLLLATCAFADVPEIKPDAPTSYVVKKGDTLWDISNLFLEKSWLWPELWRNNVQIENPHLIYPGDTLKLRYEDGVPVIEIVRDKGSITLSPDKRLVNKPIPIEVLPWNIIAPYISNDSMMESETYQALPALLGDHRGTPRFVSTDYVLAHKLPATDIAYQVVRKQRDVIDSQGRNLGVQVTHLSDAKVSNALPNERQIVRISESKREAKQGDKLTPVIKQNTKDLKIVPADRQTGEVVQNVNGNVLSGQTDFVIINVGKRQVKPGTVFGIYQQGPDVLYDEKPSYTLTRSSIVDMFSFKERVEQPAYKIGELIVVRTYENASYAWVTKSTTYMKGGELIAKP